MLPPAAMAMCCDDEAPDVARAAALRAQHHRAAVTVPRPPVPRPLRDRSAQLLRPDRAGRRGRRLERRRLAASSATTKLGAVGRPHAGVEVRVDRRRRALGPHADHVAGQSSADLGDRIDDEGWVRTGDIGRVDEDGLRLDRRSGLRHGQPGRLEGVPRRGRGGAARGRRASRTSRSSGCPTTASARSRSRSWSGRFDAGSARGPCS